MPQIASRVNKKGTKSSHTNVIILKERPTCGMKITKHEVQGKLCEKQT